MVSCKCQIRLNKTSGEKLCTVLKHQVQGRDGDQNYSKLTADDFAMSACSAVSGSAPKSQKKPHKDPTEKSKFFLGGLAVKKFMTDHPPKKKLGFRKGWSLVSVKSDSIRLRASSLAQS